MYIIPTRHGHVITRLHGKESKSYNIVRRDYNIIYTYTYPKYRFNMTLLIEKKESGFVDHDYTDVVFSRYCSTFILYYFQTGTTYIIYKLRDIIN